MVKWKGYTVGENTWEGLDNLKNSMKKIEEFEKGRFEEEIQRKRDEVKSQGRIVQERRIAREIYSEVVI